MGADKKISVLIAGVTGFIGTHLSKHLSEKGYEVSGLIRRDSATRLMSAFVSQWHYWDDIPDLSTFDVVINLTAKAHDTEDRTEEEEYFRINYGLNNLLFERLLDSTCRRYIYMSSVKAVADTVDGVLSEDDPALPLTPYGQSKWEAEKHLNTHKEDVGLLILRPVMVYGTGNKGNLSLLYNFVSRGLPWPLAGFDNQRSFLSIRNLCHVVEMYVAGKLASGTYNVADSDSVSTRQLIEWMAEAIGTKPRFIAIPRPIVRITAKAGDIVHLPLNSERLKKLTENYVVSNRKLINALGHELPFMLKQEMIDTLQH